jgi:hypothetical protein
MKKKIILGLIAVVAVIGGVAGMAAYEAHVINVTAHIENAMFVDPAELTFGTVFPQEYLEQRFIVNTSDSFCAATQTRVLDIDYKIVRKPKPINPEDHDYCYEHRNDETKPTDYDSRCYPSMCDALSLHRQDSDVPNDTGFDSFTDSDAVIAYGSLHKYVDGFNELPDNKTDIWVLDLDVPCFEGMCAQDWTYQGWELPAELEGTDFGCDLWVEVTDIYNRSDEEQACLDSGGSVVMTMCCLSADDFPDICATGACGCALENSHMVKTCQCPAGECFNGTTCE